VSHSGSSDQSASRWRWIGLAAALVLGLLLAYVAVVFYVSGEGRVARNTEVLGVPVGGLSQDRAVQVLSDALADRADDALVLLIDDNPHDIVPTDAGLTFDSAGTLTPALGRLWAPSELFPRLWGSRDVDPVASVDNEALSAAVSSLAADVDVAAVEPSITYDGVEPVLRPGSPGRALNQGAARDALTRAFLRSSEPIRLDLDQVAPAVSNETAQEVLEREARIAVADPIVVRVTGENLSASAVLTPAEIARALQFAVADSLLRPVIDAEVLALGITSELVDITQPGRDATFEIVNGAPRVVPSVTGVGVTPGDLSDAVLPVITRPDLRQVSVGLGLIEPELTTAEAEALGITEQLSTFTQAYPYAAYRETNIGKAAERINGSLLMPEQVYSHNGTLLERTAANGYVKGFIIGPGGVFKEELGGGVSASATAVWTAAFFAGMEPVQVRAHSIWISRYRPGLEATVSWGNFDMAFRNSSKSAVFITARTTKTSITISFWGTREYDDIRAESGEKRQVREFNTITGKGPDCLEQDGQIGFTISVDRVFVRSDVEVKKERFTTVYRPSPTVVCPKPPAPSPSPTRTRAITPSPTPTPALTTPTPSATATP
jgi:vancomycin resistance protein YoaR